MPNDIEAPASVPVKPAGARASTLLTVGTLAAVVVVTLVTVIVILTVPVSYFGKGNGSPPGSPCPVQDTNNPVPPAHLPPPNHPPQSEWRAQLLELVNEVRRGNNAGPLCYNTKLNVASQGQSESGKYGHTWDFVAAAGYSYSSLGQNIAMGQSSVQQVFDAWFNEIPPDDGHRRNILNSAFTQMGAGWVSSNNMWTQNFGTSSTEPCA